MPAADSLDLEAPERQRREKYEQWEALCEKLEKQEAWEALKEDALAMFERVERLGRLERVEWHRLERQRLRLERQRQRQKAFNSKSFV